jgi:hypothetical protein
MSVRGIRQKQGIEADDELGAATAARLDCSTMQLHDSLRARQTDTKPTLRLLVVSGTRRSGQVDVDGQLVELFVFKAKYHKTAMTNQGIPSNIKALTQKGGPSGSFSMAPAADINNKTGVAHINASVARPSSTKKTLRIPSSPSCLVTKIRGRASARVVSQVHEAARFPRSPKSGTHRTFSW